ncbi:hypothetical protein [Chitinophaga sp. GbtcB8]|uniref:hypothetical protein n=1 Tax=Chitinophaga sp. GbtcB8 TaxID=2824753 RepID=UPI001C30317A|nr:hypothetical protein [Chitinophaga sp. GbtcB8]
MASWLIQTEGIIDHGNIVQFIGTQPARVLTQIVLHFFRNTHVNFFEEIVNLIESGKLDNEIDYGVGEVPLQTDKGDYRTPKITIASRSIQLHESFYSYQWSITYAIYALFLETIDYPKMNEIAGFEKYKISQDKILQAKDLFAYAKSLIVMYSEWNKDEMPNPERYNASNRDYIEQTNVFFTEGMKFILCHEYIHAKKHLDNLPESSCDDCFKDMEVEADNEAIDLLLKGTSPSNRFVIDIGVVLGVVSMFFFSATTTGRKHPNAEERLTNALERLAISDDSHAWAFACVGLELWDEQFSLELNWKGKGSVSYKALYYDIMSQIKQKNAGSQPIEGTTDGRLAD